MKKRIISMILSIIMAIGILPIVSFAAEANSLKNFTKRNSYTDNTFADVHKDDWYYENIKKVYELGLMNGKGNGKFDTQSGVTIAETLTIAARLHSIYTTGKENFKSGDPWYQVYVNYCKAKGIASVNSKTYTKQATRAEFVSILANALPAEVFAEINSVADDAIPDVKSSDTYGAAVYKMYRAGIMVGNDSAGTFAPSSNIKRSEVAAIVTRIVDISLRKSIQLGNIPVEDASQITTEQGQMMVNLVNHIGQLTTNGATRQDIRTELEKLKWIDMISDTPDGGLCCRTTFGIIATWTPCEDGKIASNATTTYSTNLISQSIFDDLQNYDYDVKEIVILCPYASVDSDFMIDGYASLANGISQEINCKVTWLLDEEVSLEALKNLDMYDMVWFYSHGSLSNITNSSWDIVDSDPYTMTGEIVNSAFEYVMLSEDWFSGRTIINLDTGRIGVGGDFYEYYYNENELRDIFFHFASCNSMYSNELAEGILSRGAAWVEGWTSSVWFTNDYAQFLHVINNLVVNGDNIKDSISKANEYVKNTYDFWQEDCMLKGLGNFYYHIDSPTKSKDITFEKGYTVSGRLICGNDVAVANMDVVLGNNTNTYYSKTDLNGYFEFTNVAAAQVYALESGDGVTYEFYVDTDISVIGDTDLGNIYLDLVKGSEKTGTVTIKFRNASTGKILKLTDVCSMSDYDFFMIAGKDKDYGGFLCNGEYVVTESSLIYSNIPEGKNYKFLIDADIFDEYQYPADVIFDVSGDTTVYIDLEAAESEFVIIDVDMSKFSPLIANGK